MVTLEIGCYCHLSWEGLELLSSNPSHLHWEGLDILSIIKNHFYIVYNVNERKRVGRDWVFLGLAGLPLGISLGLAGLPLGISLGPTALGKSLGAALPALGKSLEAALPALGKPSPSLLFSFHYISVIPQCLLWVN